MSCKPFITGVITILTRYHSAACEKISENMHIVANEPSLAFYRVQEHCRKAIPVIVERQKEVLSLQKDLQGHCYDLEYSLGLVELIKLNGGNKNTLSFSAVKSLSSSVDLFSNIHDMLKNAIFLKQQLKYEEQRNNKKEVSNIYKRFSAHINLDLPDISSGVSRVVMMTGSSRNTTPGGPELQRSYTTLR